MDMHQTQLLGQEIGQAINQGIRDGFAAMEKPIDLRDFFAGCAVSGMWACSVLDITPEKMAALAYHTADAMLLEKIGKGHA